jgi:Bacterial PH domain
VSRADVNPVVRAVFRLPRSAYLPVLFLTFGVTVLVSSWAWTAVYLVPLLAAFFVARRATLVDTREITVRAMFGHARIPWSRVRGLLISERGHVSVALDDQSAVLLPFVRVRHLPVLSQVSGNLVPAIPARTQSRTAEAATEPTAEVAPEPSDQ